MQCSKHRGGGASDVTGLRARIRRSCSPEEPAMRLRLLAAPVLLAAALATHAQERDFSKIEVKVAPVSGSVYLLQGAGGNIAASVGEDGVVMVDDEFAPIAGRIMDALKSIGPAGNRLRYVLLTHYHFDHTGGNAPFAAAGATLVAHDKLRARLMIDSRAGNGGSMKIDSKAVEKAALPTLTFADSLTVHLNGEDVRAQHFASAHTDGDAIVFFANAHVVHMGDIFVRYGFPFIDVDTGGSVQGMIAACEATLAQLPDDAKIIPGHGDVATVADLREYLKLLKDTTAVVEKALKSGQSLAQMQQANLLGAWSAKYNGDFVKADTFLESLYYSLTKARHAAAAKRS
jgi:cyclase